MKSKTYSIALLDAPATLGALSSCDSVPVAVAFLSGNELQEFCRKFGFLMLLSQNLEMELRLFLNYVSLVELKYGKKVRFEIDPDKANFHQMVGMFKLVLDMKNSGSKQVINDMYEAKKLRNHLAHAFMDTKHSRLLDFLTQGGRNKVSDEMDRMLQILYPITSLIISLRTAYAAELGLTQIIEDWRKNLQDQLDAGSRMADDILGDLN